MVKSIKNENRIEFVSLTKKLTWAATLFALIIPAAVAAAPGMPSLSCNSGLDRLITGMKNPNNLPYVAANSTIIVGDRAYAEGALPATNGGYPGIPGGQAKPSGVGISGHGNLGALPINAVFPLTFEIEKSPSGRGKIKWTFKDQNYQADVTSCWLNYWTATSFSSTPNSSITINLGAVTSALVP